MKKILLSSLVIGVVAVVAIGATIAYFTDRDTLGVNTVNSANLSINIDESAHSVPITVAGLLPGQSSNPYLVRFENDGGVPVKYAWSAERMVRGNERLNNESLMLFEVLHVEVAEYISGTLTLVYAGPLSELTLKEGTNTLNSGGARNARFVFSMPTSAGNEYKALTTQFNLILDATQITNPGWGQYEFSVTQNSGQNDINRSLNRPHINWEIEGKEITLEFVNPTAFQFAFDYRVDMEDGEIHSWSDIVIKPGGELAGELIGERYNWVNPGANGTATRTITANETVWVGLRVGAENDWFLDWIIFEL